GFDQSKFASVEGHGSVNFRHIPFNDNEVGNAYIRCASELFSLVKNRIREGKTGGCQIQVVFPDKGNTMLLNGLSAMLKTASLESPKISWQVIMVDAGMDGLVVLKKVDADASRFTNKVIYHTEEIDLTRSLSELDK